MATLTFRKLLLVLLATATRAAIGAGEVAVVDDAGQELRLKAPAQRVVSLAPDLAELMFAAGAGGRLIAVAEHSDFPAAARTLPRIGNAHGFDYERIVALRPDLVLGWAGGNAPQHLARLKALGLPVYLADIRRPEDIASTLERLGTLTGGKAVAASAAQVLRERWSAIEKQYAARRPLKVFYQVWHQPLYTLGGTHLVSAALRTCGAENAFADLASLAAVIETESVLQRDPEVIVASAEGAKRPAWLDQWRRWPRLRAVRREGLLVVDADLMNRHSPRFVEGTEKLCAALDDERRKTVE